MTLARALRDTTPARSPRVRYTVGYQPISRERFPKLDVAGSNPVGRSKSRGYGSP